MRWLMIPAMALVAVAGWSAPAVVLDFNADLTTATVKPVVAEKVSLVAGRSGLAALLGPDTQLAYPVPGFLTEGFDIRLWVRHNRALRDLHFEELVYLYHETPDEKNRICLLKRAGTDYILFAMSDGTGRAKGAQFAGNWFAMKSGPLNWAANSWHELRLVASRARGEAALYIDGGRVAAAQGSEMPTQLGDRLWLGSLKGRSQMQGVLDDVTIAPAAGE